MNKWYELRNKEDIVISSRIRLARNIPDYNFPCKMSEEEYSELAKKVRDLVPFFSEKEGMRYYSCLVGKLSPMERSSLREWYLISETLVHKDNETALILSEDEGISIMVGEEDHLRIQSVAPGDDLDGAYVRAEQLDRIIEEKLGYAFDSKYGYLTSFPMNAGTGMRASFLVFLPALTVAGKIQKIADEISRYGVQIRGVLDEGVKTLGYLYRISNQKSLGITEEEIIDNLKSILKQIVREEQKYRDHIKNISSEEILDKVYRSYGVLRYAKRISGEDAQILLSQLKFGMDLGLISFKKVPDVYELMILMQPANLQKLARKSLNQEERAVFRAEYLNKVMEGAELSS